MRLAFFLVLALVCVGLIRGDFASDEARSEEAPAFFVASGDSARATPSEPLAERAAEAEQSVGEALGGALSDLLTRYRAWHQAPVLRDALEARAPEEWTVPR